jgi:hypothetical protein
MLAMDSAEEKRHGRVVALAAGLGDLARELTQLSAAAGKASAAADVDALCEVSELMLQAHVRYAERYRTLLVVRLREPRPGTYSPGADLASL